MYGKIFAALFALFIPLSVNATFTPQAATFTCGGTQGWTRVIPKQILMFHAKVSLPSYFGIVLNHKTQTPYQPSGSNKFCVIGFSSNSPGYGWRLVQGDNNVASTSYDSSTVPTNAVYDSSASAVPSTGPGPGYSAIAQTGTAIVCQQYEMTNGKYLYTYASGGSGDNTVYGYESTSCDW